MIEFGREVTGDVDAVMRREWLVTNGIGGYAMGTPSGARTRRYHGLLVAAYHPPAERMLLVAALDTWIEIEGSKHPLCTHEWAAGVLLPDGYRHLESFSLEGTIPTWVWTLGDTRIVQRLWMQPGKNTTYTTYECTRGSRPVTLQVIPLVTHRDHHRDTKGGQAIHVKIAPPEDKPDKAENKGYYSATISATEDLGRDPNAAAPRPFRILSDADSANVTAEWWWSFHLAQETERGLTDHEDLFAALTFRKRLKPGETLVLISTAETETPIPWRESLAEVRQRDQSLLATAKLDDAPKWLRHLALAADQFIVDRQIGDGDGPGKSVLAGYPWFSDWGRDTMIALPGLTVSVNRPEIAESVLCTFAHYVDQGMLPNRFPDRGEAPEYNTADATLWYFEAVRAYLEHRDNSDLLNTLYPILSDIVEWHIKGTRFGIKVDPTDGLLHTGEAGIQLTWMDVKIDDWVVTPRTGKAVEINALWHNALRIMHDLAKRLGKAADAKRYLAMAERVHESFNARFWYEAGYLYDVIDTPEGVDDASLRPNQLFAVSLPYPLLDPVKARSVVDICARELVTSAGLRSLAPDETDYVGHFGGDVRSRDGAYHQGTVWSWLLGPFVIAHYKVYHDAALAYTYLEPMRYHLYDAGLGTISEVFDGDPPYNPKGCIAQAWGVSEVLRAYRMLEADLKR